MRSPSQEIYDYFFKVSKTLGYDTYDHLPIDDVSYPFVNIAETQLVSDFSKTSLNGTIILAINVWGTYKQRLKVSTMCDAIHHQAIGHIDTDNYHFFAHVNAHSINLIEDNSVPDTSFIHGIMSLEFEIE
ncbi:hypothetical protein [Lactobacillus acetotolerans]|uniref:hypothetical protein n=1 Tax=Lactobacillus acetotolerans TaxID=1600 RepID=UPI002FD9414B